MTERSKDALGALVQRLLAIDSVDLVQGVLRDIPPGMGYDLVDALAAQVGALTAREGPARGRWAATICRLVAAIADEPRVHSRAQWASGNAALLSDAPREAEVYYREAIAGYTVHGPAEKVPRIELASLLALSLQGRHLEAIQLADRLRDTLLSAPSLDREALFKLESNVARPLQEMGLADAALGHLSRARRLMEGARSASEHHLGLSLDLNIAFVLESDGRLPEAEARFRAVKGQLRRAGRHGDANIAELHLCWLSQLRGHYVEAIAELDVLARRRDSDEMVVATAAIYQAQCFLKLNLHREALRAASQALDHFSHTGYVELLACSALMLARAHLSMALAGAQAEGQPSPGTLELAEVKRALAMGLAATSGAGRQGRWGRELLMEGANAAAITGRWVLARGLMRRAERLLIPGRSPLVRLKARLLRAQLGLNEDKSRLEGMGAALEEALGIIRDHGLDWERPQVDHLQGRLAEARGDSTQARVYHRQACEGIAAEQGQLTQDLLRIIHLADKQRLFAPWIRLCVEEESLAELLMAVDLSRAAPLTGSLSRGPDSAIAGALQAESAALRERLHAIRSAREADIQLVGPSGPASLTERGEATLECSQRIVESQLLQLEICRQAGISPRQPEPEALGSRTLQVGERLLGELSALLPEDGALVVYFEAPQLGALVIDRDHATLCLLPTERGALRRLLDVNWRGGSLLAASHKDRHTPRRRSGTQRVLRALGDILWTPLADPLGGARQVWISLPPSLSDLPIHALHDGQAYAVESRSFTYLTAPSRLPEAQEGARCPEGSPALVIGDSWRGRLTGALDEAFNVAELLKRVCPTQLLLEPDATVEQASSLLPAAGFIHISAHGHFRGDNPFFSHIELGRRHLDLLTLYNLRLLARPLIVLTACDAGRSWGSGDALLGLTRALCAAGARGVVAPLWQVPEDASKAFSMAFYRALFRDGGGSISQAMAAAAREQIAEGLSPLDWAVFGYVGG